MTTNKVPQIRFKGFSGEWEEKVLIDIANFINEKILLNELTLSNYISTENLLQNFRGVLISSKLPNSKTVTQFKINDILISNIRPYLKKVWSATFNGGASNDVLVVRAKGDIKNHFLTYFLKNEKFINYIMEGTKGVKMPRGDISLIKKYSLFISLDSNEQTKIGNYFQNLDKLIEQKEKKHKKLEQLKKAMLEKMFPKDGEDTPEIRFKGFSGEWEETEIDKLFTVTRGNVLSATETRSKQSEYMPYPVYSSQTKNNGLLGYYNTYLFENAITWTTDGANAGTVKYRDGKFYSTNVNGVLLSEEGYANQAIAEILNLIAWKHVSYVGNPKLMNNVMSKIKIYIPNSIKEQNNISNLLIKLDKLIDLQLQELEKLKNIKKASLDKMFV